MDVWVSEIASGSPLAVNDPGLPGLGLRWWDWKRGGG